MKSYDICLKKYGWRTIHASRFQWFRKSGWLKFYQGSKVIADFKISEIAAVHDLDSDTVAEDEANPALESARAFLARGEPRHPTISRAKNDDH